jgi:hypothetical protein
LLLYGHQHLCDSLLISNYKFSHTILICDRWLLVLYNLRLSCS